MHASVPHPKPLQHSHWWLQAEPQTQHTGGGCPQPQPRSLTEPSQTPHTGAGCPQPQPWLVWPEQPHSLGAGRPQPQPRSLTEPSQTPHTGAGFPQPVAVAPQTMGVPPPPPVAGATQPPQLSDHRNHRRLHRNFSGQPAGATRVYVGSCRVRKTRALHLCIVALEEGEATLRLTSARPGERCHEHADHQRRAASSLKPACHFCSHPAC
jgi:hypothetical protein